jgi:ATP-dependent exoDNAse (exonuclease V) alpha subunit
MNLFHALLKAVPAGVRLILVGDVNQLPSVGPGCVLQDLIESGSFRTIMLRHVFRQASESDIVMNAHRILEGDQLPMDNKSRDFFFLERDQVPVIYKHTVQLIREMLPGYVGCRPEDIQVLTPMRRGSLGVERLNEILQSVLNPPAKESGNMSTTTRPSARGTRSCRPATITASSGRCAAISACRSTAGPGSSTGISGGSRRSTSAARS